MSLNESIVEDAALTWFGELGYTVGHGPQLAPGEPAAERASFGEVVLVGRLRAAIRRLNPAIPEEAREEALRKVLRVGPPSLTQTNRAFHRMLRDGVPVEYPRPDGSIAGDHVRLVDCRVALPGQLFYSTQIPVCLWFLANNKNAAAKRGFRDRRQQTLFIDARKLGTLIARVHRELTDADLQKINSAIVKFSLN